MEDICSEAIRLEKNGVREITLIGQDVTAYGRDLKTPGANLVTLLEKLIEKTSIDWIRLLYLYPDKVKDPLLRLIASEKRLLNYFDIPLQHISEKILRKMGRPAKTSDLYSLINRIREYIPQAVIRTTFMVGFPGETENDVAKIADFLEGFRLDHVGFFTYSNEEGCPAASYADQIPEEIKQQRYDSLMQIQAKISLQKNQELIGKTRPVLVEGLSRESDLLLEGRTEGQAPDIDGCVYINEGECQAGDIVNITISDAHPYDLVGFVTP